MSLPGKELNAFARLEQSTGIEIQPSTASSGGSAPYGAVTVVPSPVAVMAYVPAVLDV
jgi:hypothetical protein